MMCISIMSHLYQYHVPPVSVSCPTCINITYLQVLNDVYQYHVPPVRRIPPLLWTRIRNDLPNYFSEREADGVTVINWYHRQFVEASAERYFRNMNFVEETHSLLADYFLGVWGGGREKPFQYTELQRQRFTSICMALLFS